MTRRRELTGTLRSLVSRHVGAAQWFALAVHAEAVHLPPRVHVLAALLGSEAAVGQTLGEGELDGGRPAGPARAVEEEAELVGVAHQHVLHRLASSARSHVAGLWGQGASKV